MKYSILAATVLLALVSWAAADDKDVHIDPARAAQLPWMIKDGGDMRWDINTGGEANDGTRSAYSGGAMRLVVNGNQFYYSGQTQITKDGREIEVGPWNNNQLRVSRRVYIDPKQSYCRWIDLFENSTNMNQSLSVQYSINLGFSPAPLLTSSGKGVRVTPKDYAFLTTPIKSDDSGNSQTTTVHVFGGRSSKVRPNVQVSSNIITYTANLTLEPGQTVGMCFFESQHTGPASATAFLKSFNPDTEVAKLPAGLRKILHNFPAPRLSLDSIDLQRNEQNDLAILANGNEVLGTLLNETYEVQTFYGKIALEAAKVLGVNIPAQDEDVTQVVLTDGQVVSGKLLTAPLRIKLVNGSEMSIATKDLKQASYRISPARPSEFRTTSAAVVLRNGQRLFFRAADAESTFHTSQGDIKLSKDEVATLYLDTPEGGLHRVVFRNGSVLSGLLLAPKLSLKLDLGPTLDVSQNLVSRINFSSPPETDEAAFQVLVLRNENELRGKIVEPALDIQTDNGKITVKPEEVALAELGEGALGQIEVKLHNGTSLTGTLLNKSVKFKIEPGPEINVFVGHIQSMTSPKAATDAAATNSTTTESSVAPQIAPLDVFPKPAAPAARAAAVDRGAGATAERAAMELKLRAKLAAAERAEAENAAAQKAAAEAHKALAEKVAAQKAAADKAAAEKVAAEDAAQQLKLRATPATTAPASKVVVDPVKKS